MEYVLETRNLCKQYKHFKALDDFNMHVPKGSIYGFVGKNGAGKTTLIRQVCGLQAPTSGELSIFGASNNDTNAISKARSRMGAVVETPSIFLDMTAKENLKAQYRVLGLPDFDEIDELLSFVGLSDTGAKKAKNFSLGMKQRLGIAMALCGHPDFLILDEPINGLDPEGIIEVRELILKLNKENNITFIISSHILDELSKLATWYGFIDAGHMIKEMSADELETACRKCINVKVSDLLAFSRVMEERKLEYKIKPDDTADIYSEITITELVNALSKQNCELISVKDRDESLEGFYLNLLGGERHE